MRIAHVLNRNYIILTLLVIFVSCTPNSNSFAPGAPGDDPFWAYSGKTGIGTSYEMYVDGQFEANSQTGKVSKVWFSVADGIITETMYGLIHHAQIKEMQFVIVGDDFVHTEQDDTESTIEYLYTDEHDRPLSLAYKITNREPNGRYTIEKHVFTNPNEDALFIRVIFKSTEEGITPYLYVNPHVANTGGGDFASVTRKALNAFEGETNLTLTANRKFEKVSAGFVGVSDGLSELNEHGKLVNRYSSTGDIPGNVAMIAELKPMTSDGVTYDFVLGFGQGQNMSEQAARNTLKTGYREVLANYNGEGDYVGWSDYLEQLSELERLSSIATDNGKLLYASALVLKAQEDKTHAGALIASLSNPWGETVSAAQPATGYKGVWPRDFYQVAMAFTALGDFETPLSAFEYLPKVQVSDDTQGNEGATGWFMQKTHVDGNLEWVSVQLDQTAMPIKLGWKLWQKGILSDEKAKEWYHKMLKPAAEFLVDGGKVNLDWNTANVTPPSTQQERWEEQAGYSPSTMASVVAGLICAAELANLAGESEQAAKYLATADRYEQMIEKTTFTTNGPHGNGNYYIRISGSGNPNTDEKLAHNNGRPGFDQRLILDGGFLELVRYGVRAANSEYVLESLPELDNIELEDNLRVKYLFSFDGDNKQYPGWRRYGNDGYGEDEVTAGNYGPNTPGQRGRVWPFFTGERGHYELASAVLSGNVDVQPLRETYVKAMEYFANEGLMLPEQVWDGVGVAPEGYRKGYGTNSATPLAWTHAEYVKLLRSISDAEVWDNYPNVAKRYAQ